MEADSRAAVETDGALEAAGPVHGVSRRTFLGGVAAGAAGLGVASIGGTWLGASPALAQGDPFAGEIRMFAGNFAISGWALCHGQLLSIAENSTLFQLIGTTYGGDGETTFGLPNLQGRMPLHQGGGFTLAEMGGVETVTLNTEQIPAHAHTALGSSGSGATGNPTQATWATLATGNAYSNLVPAVQMNAGALANAGGSQPHDNMSPFLVVNFIICLFGIFPQSTRKRK